MLFSVTLIVKCENPATYGSRLTIKGCIIELT